MTPHTPPGAADPGPSTDVAHRDLAALEHGLVVSCQAYPGEPMRDPRVMSAVARAVVDGGAVAVRLQGAADIAATRQFLQVPIIGLIKQGTTGVYITPTLDSVRAVIDAGADIVATDATARPRPDGLSLAATIETAHAAGRAVMADCGSLADAEHAVELGVDCIGTTLAGYTDDREPTPGPDFDLLGDLVGLSAAPVIAEGRVRTPEDVRRCFDTGAYAVVVGTAITHPTAITRRFVEASRAATRRSDGRDW